tara:strand:+ start:639 stop:860 length:222 start_codon:yes stop_codon:yes gene_type:complete
MDCKIIIMKHGIKNMSLYNTFVQMKIEIERHKWIESEKQRHDIGFEKALVDWISKHRLGWIDSYTTTVDEKQR